MLKAKFKENFNLGQDIVVDEAVVKGKGRNPIKQYNAKKPIKRGSKVWCLADCMTHYLWDFNVYCGKIGNQSVKGLACKVVKDLVEPLKGIKHVVYADNYFCSLKLVKDLATWLISLCGTTLSNRKGFPAPLKQLTERKMAKYEYHFCKAANTENLYFTVWRDKKLVTFLSNVHPPTGETTVWRRQKDGNRILVPCPPVANDYNDKMGGVDANDHLCQSYSVDRRSRRYKHVSTK